ncbi:hypothetical protein Ancab_023294 [Ancistrocladus abbreviatus]
MLRKMNEWMEIEDEGTLLKNLETIWVDSFKLRFDKARRRNEAMRSKDSKLYKWEPSWKVDKHQFRSYKEALLSRNPEGAEFFSSKMTSGSDKMESRGEVKKATLDSLSRIPCTPEEMYSARSEKEVHRSGDIHATLREDGSKSDKFSSESSKLRRDKKGHTEAFQKMDGHFGETPPHFQFQNLKKHKGNCFQKKSFSSQQMDRERKEHRDRYIGPVFVGPSNLEEETTSTQGVMVHSSQDIPV